MQTTQSGQAAGSFTATRVAAVVLMGAPLLEILGMAHHPSVTAHGAEQLVAGLRQYAQLSATVHGVLIALLLATLAALGEFARTRGLVQALVRNALLAYGIGAVLMVCAALVSGFITPHVADLAPDVAPPDPVMSLRLAALAMLFNQAFARSGALLMSMGIGLWSADLLRTRDWLLGGLGIACGAGCAVGVAAGLLRLDVHGMMAVTVVQALWTVGAGAYLLRRTTPR